MDTTLSIYPIKLMFLAGLPQMFIFASGIAVMSLYGIAKESASDMTLMHLINNYRFGLHLLLTMALLSISLVIWSFTARAKYFYVACRKASTKQVLIKGYLCLFLLVQFLSSFIFAVMAGLVGRYIGIEAAAGIMTGILVTSLGMATVIKIKQVVGKQNQ